MMKYVVDGSLKNRTRAVVKMALVFCLAVTSQVHAQDLEPRILSAIPTGGNFAVASYGFSSGNILLDNSLPIEDLNARMNNLAFAYARSTKLFTRLAKFDVIVPFSFADFSGEVYGTDSSTSRTGFGDPMLRLSILLVGNKAMNMNDFIKSDQKKFNLGVFVRVRPPLGQYNPHKLINLGANRWATKLGMAASYSFHRKFVLEGHLNSWFFTENSEFFNGNVLKQKPLLSAQLHGTYIFKPGVWLALSGGRSFMGETIVNGVERNDDQTNSRFGTAFACKLNQNNAVKIGITSGISTRYGADFTSIFIAYQYLWFDRKNITK
jgi:hypothetical protein